MKLYTIGFTKKSAEKFFGLLRRSGTQRVVDVRLNNVSQLAGFAKRKDLEFFLQEVCSIDYVHLPELAPTKDMLDDLKKRGGDWSEYEERFLSLMEDRGVQHSLSKGMLEQGCLLCSEDKPHHCHRRLVAEYLQRYWGRIEVVHLT